MNPISCLPLEINILIAEFLHDGPLVVRKDGYISFRRNLLYDEFSIGRRISDGCHAMKINNSIRMWSQEDTIVGRRRGVLLRMFTRIHVRDQTPETDWDIDVHGLDNDYVRITYTMRHILDMVRDIDRAYVWKLQIQKQTMMGSFPAFMPVAQRRSFIHSNHAYETYKYQNIITYNE